MKESIKGPRVENVAVAIVQSIVEGELNYYAYLLSTRDDIMECIIIASTGYG